MGDADTAMPDVSLLQTGLLARTQEVSGNAPNTDVSCPLPDGAKWCNALTNGKVRRLAVYALYDPVSAIICDSGRWEFDSVAQMDVHEPGVGKTFLDIGANIGWYSVLFADAGYKVLSVEPMTANRQMLQATLCANPDLSSKIQIIPLALARKPTHQGQLCDIYSATINLGDGLLVCPGEEERKNDVVNNPDFHHEWRESISTMSLDQWMDSKGSPQVDVIKMDVEGYECKALEGALQTFYKPKYIMVEVRDDTWQCIEFVLMGHGYVSHTDRKSVV